MPDEIQPAFAPGFWPLVLEQLAKNDGGWGATLVDTVGFKEERRHEAAAIALYGQPFGFTRDEVEAVRDAARELVALTEDGSQRTAAERHAAELRAVAAKLAALLPPETP